ncbi:phosphodiester glycosidase family protein [cf. Phormidesmis sp. LEGE 11477]|nr:phosphodiester glycosidase family protein [cf. Phormidesmis sp. LEGE 11477]
MDPKTAPKIENNKIDTARTTSADAIRAYGHRTHVVGEAIAHVVTQPVSAELSIAVAEDLATGLATIEAFAEDSSADYIINGGFFDPNNGKTTSHLISQGQTIGDPADNERLVDNLDLSQYMPQILNRSEFRVYRCRSADADVANATTYDITFHDAPPPDGCRVSTAIGAGPQLLPIDTSETEAFIDYDNGTLIRDAIGSLQPNARSAIGLYPDGAIALIMVEKNASSSGMTLLELADFAKSLGITKLLNLDGGSSSALFVAGQTYFGLADAEDNPVRRPVKSVILLTQPDR